MDIWAREDVRSCKSLSFLPICLLDFFFFSHLGHSRFGTIYVLFLVFVETWKNPNKKQITAGYKHVELLSHFTPSMTVRKFRTLCNRKHQLRYKFTEPVWPQAQSSNYFMFGRFSEQQKIKVINTIGTFSILPTSGEQKSPRAPVMFKLYLQEFSMESILWPKRLNIFYHSIAQCSGQFLLKQGSSEQSCFSDL